MSRPSLVGGLVRWSTSCILIFYSFSYFLSAIEHINQYFDSLLCSRGRLALCVISFSLSSSSYSHFRREQTTLHRLVVLRLSLTLGWSVGKSSAPLLIWRFQACRRGICVSALTSLPIKTWPSKFPLPIAHPCNLAVYLALLLRLILLADFLIECAELSC